MTRRKRAEAAPPIAPPSPDALAALEAFRKEHHAKGFEEGWRAAASAIMETLREGPAAMLVPESFGSAPPADVGPIPEKVNPPTEAEAREQGRKHAQDGYSRTLCPYFRGSKLAAAWDEGWVEGEVRG